jgi:hypothetical protein
MATANFQSSIADQIGWILQLWIAQITPDLYNGTCPPAPNVIWSSRVARFVMYVNVPWGHVTLKRHVLNKNLICPCDPWRLMMELHSLFSK